MKTENQESDPCPHTLRSLDRMVFKQDPSESPEEAFETHIRKQFIRALLRYADLPPTQYEAICLYYGFRPLDGSISSSLPTMEEIGERFGCGHEAIRQRLQKGIARLQKAYAECGVDLLEERFFSSEESVAVEQMRKRRKTSPFIRIPGERQEELSRREPGIDRLNEQIDLYGRSRYYALVISVLRLRLKTDDSYCRYTYPHLYA